MTSLVILGAFLALAVLAVLGNPILGAIFIVIAGVVLGHHAVSLCPRCSNLACAFNPRASKAELPDFESADAEAFTDLPITRTTVIPLLLFGPLAFIGAWQYNPVAAVVVRRRPRRPHRLPEAHVQPVRERLCRQLQCSLPPVEDLAARGKNLSGGRGVSWRSGALRGWPRDPRRLRAAEAERPSRHNEHAHLRSGVHVDGRHVGQLVRRRDARPSASRGSRRSCAGPD